MHLTLDLSRHCIETEIKKRHNRCISRYFKKNGERPAIEAELDLLGQALATLDFGALRIRHPALNGHSDATVVLTREDDGRLAIRINGAAVDLSAGLRQEPP